MKYFIFFLFFLPVVVFGKTYDCFPFFNELELLKIRLGELDDTVDYFVLVESIETQRGAPKKLYFEENKHLFSDYLEKIIHIAVRETHPEFSIWEREHFQRDCILRGLTKCNDKDIILISDLDEIPKKSCLREAKRLLKKEKEEAITFRMPDHRFYLNRKMRTASIFCTVGTTYKNLKKTTPQFFRSRNTKWYALYDAGWHFSYMGGRERVRKKLQSIVEGTDDVSEITDERIDEWIDQTALLPIDDQLPQYVLDHVDELIDIGFIDIKALHHFGS